MSKNNSSGALYCGDNLIVLPQYIPKESVDLVYLDPPFLPKPGNCVIQKGSKAQAKAFADFWRWSEETNSLLHRLITTAETVGVGKFLDWMRNHLGQKPMMAYLVNIAARLIEFRKVLKPTGTLYFHCSPLTSGYTQLLLDTIFPGGFINEVIWKRSEMHKAKVRYGGVHDNIYIYAKGKPWTWHPPRIPHEGKHLKKKYSGVSGYRPELTGPGIVKIDPPWLGYDPKEHGRHWAIPNDLKEKYYVKTGKSLAELSKTEKLDALLEEKLIELSPDHPDSSPGYRITRAEAIQRGKPVFDMWTDISPIKGGSKQKIDQTLTQKPEELANRIISVSSNPGDTVLDGFCGCGPMLVCAQRLGRKWIGIDIAAEQMVKTRSMFQTAFPEKDVLAGVPEVIVPATITEASRLYHSNCILFQNWVCRMLKAALTTEDTSRPIKDRGIDGVFTFSNGPDYQRALVSVKGGKIKVSDVRDLMGVVTREAAAIGVFVCLHPPGRNSSIREEVQQHAGGFVGNDGHRYNRLQVISVEELLGGKRIDVPQLKM